MPQAKGGKYYADPAHKPGGRYGPRGDTYLDPGMDTSKMTPPDPLEGLRAVVAANAMQPGTQLGPFDVRISDQTRLGPLAGSDPVPPIAYPPSPFAGDKANRFGRYSQDVGPLNLQVPPDSNDPALVDPGMDAPAEARLAPMTGLRLAASHSPGAGAAPTGPQQQGATTMSMPDPTAGLRASVAGARSEWSDLKTPPVPGSPWVGDKANRAGRYSRDLGPVNVMEPPDPNDPGLIEGEGMPGSYKGIGAGAGADAATVGSQVPGLSWRWGSEGAPSASQLGDQRAAFLATGASPEIGLMADAAQGRQLVDENLRNRPDLLEARSDLARLRSAEANTPEGKAAERARLIAEQDKDLAMNGIWRAKAKARAGMEEPIARARTFMDPEVSAARFTADMDPINIGLGPGATQLWQRDADLKKALAGITAAGRAAMYGQEPGIWPGMEGDEMSAPGAGYQAGKGAPPAENPAPMGPKPGQVIPYKLVEEWARSQGMLFWQAKAAIEAKGYRVDVPKLQ
jgi:hypothetical protein